MKARTCIKWALPLLIPLFSLVPEPFLRQIVYGVLAMPFDSFLGQPPFRYVDKPWFITPLGVFAAGVLWTMIVYALMLAYVGIRSVCRIKK